MTLLFQQPGDKGGLQVLQHNKVWQDVPYLEGAIVVNIGDALEFWTAGVLRSTVHRVVFPRSQVESGSRFSIPFFVQPDSQVLLKPLVGKAEAASNEQQSKFIEILRGKGYTSTVPMTAGEHLRTRIAATYQN